MNYHGLKIEIEHDSDAESPREWDNIGVMVCFHKRYRLGDKHDLRSADFGGWDQVETYLRREKGAVIVLPLHLLDHSGLRLKVGSFLGHAPHAEWDSGQVGFIYATREAVIREYGKTRLTRAALEKAEKYLRGEVETYDAYLSGDVHQWAVLDESGEAVESCGGCYGYEYAETEAKRAADSILAERAKTLAGVNAGGDGI